MSDLTTIIQNDSRKLRSFGMGFGEGAVQGLYSPFLIITGITRQRQKLNEYIHFPTSTEDKENNTRLFGDFLGQILSATLSGAGELSWAIVNRHAKEYVLVMAATNMIDYLVQAYQRSQRSE